MKFLTLQQSTLLEYVLLVAIFVPLVLMCCALAVAWDIHATRLEFSTANDQWRRESMRRVDQLLWKADTALEIGGAMRLDLGTMLTKLRVQVKQSSDESSKATTVQAKAATLAVTKALETTNEAIQAVAGDTPTSPKLAQPATDNPITVNVPAPVVVTSSKMDDRPKVEVIEKPKRRHWITYLWRWW